MRLRLTIVDTPGYGDQVNNENCWDPVLRYIKEQYAAYLRKELTPARDRRIPDTRIHCVLFFIAPSGHALRPIDITVMRKLTEVTNVIPVIAKSDSLTSEEKEAFKRRIKSELDFHGIRAYPFPQTLEDIEGWDTADEREYLQKIRNMLPFSVIGSEQVVQTPEGPVRGRKTRWGVVNGWFQWDETGITRTGLTCVRVRKQSRTTSTRTLSTCASSSPGRTFKTSSRRPTTFTTSSSVRVSCLPSRKAAVRLSPSSSKVRLPASSAARLPRLLAAPVNEQLDGDIWIEGDTQHRRWRHDLFSRMCG